MTRAEWFQSGTGLVRKNWCGWDAKGEQPLPGVKVCLIGTYDEKYDPIAVIAEPNWEAYCRKHGYALRTYPGAFHTDPSKPETYGDKVRFSLYYDVRGLFDVVVILDMDSLFVDPNRRIEEALGFAGGSFVWTYGENGPMSGLLIARTDARTERHLRHAYEYAAANDHVRHGLIEPGGMSDQDAMRALMHVPPFSLTFGNCVEAESIGFCFPDTKREQPWIVTCRGGSIDEKLAVMREWAAKASPGALTPTQAASPADPDADVLPTAGVALPSHAVDAYNPSKDFDRSWAGPAELRPRVYRTQAEKDIWFGCVVQNEYRLGMLEPTDTIVDIGAHIGSFSYLAYRHGSRSVYAYEIDPWHVEAAAVNLADYQDGIALHPCAVVRGDERRASEYHYDGAWNSFGLLGPTVPSKSLDQIIDEVCSPGEPVRFLKIDCEGGEWPILSTCQQLERIQEIAGEYHLIDPAAPEMQGLPIAISTDGLRAFLEAKGFAVEIVPHAEKTGNFFARRVAVAAPPSSMDGVFVARLG